MITKIILHNWQCHKDVTLDLGQSTVLQGDSNSGKSAVLRALYWVLYNTPQGDAYVNTEAMGKNGKFKGDEYTSVLVEVDNHTVERKRSTKFNGYIVDGTDVYEALKTSVPEIVTKIFNISDDSVQRQYDAPFLLGQTPGEAAQHLNSLAGLTCIDDILAIAKRRVLTTSSDISSAKESVDELAEEIASLSWVEKAEDLHSRAQELESKIRSLRDSWRILSRLIDTYKAIPKYPTIPAWLETGDKTAQIDKLSRQSKLLNTYITVSRVLSSFSKVLRAINKLVPPTASTWRLRDSDKLRSAIDTHKTSRANKERLSEVLSKVEALDKPSTECTWTANDVRTINVLLRSSRAAIATKQEATRALDELYTSIEGVACPLCGGPMSRAVLCSGGV